MASGDKSARACKQCLWESGPGESVDPALPGKDFCSRHLNPCEGIRLPNHSASTKPFRPFYAYLGLHGSNKDIRVVGIAEHDPDFVVVEQLAKPSNASDRLMYYHKDSIFVEKLVKAFEG